MIRKAAFAIAVWLAAFAAHGQEPITVTASGSARVVKGDTKSAAEAAIEQAKRNAVEQVGSEIISQTVVENFELVKDVIVTKTSGYLKSYEVVDQSCTSSSCEVEIRAEVSAKELKDDATLIYHEMDKPRVMVLITETGESGEAEVKSNVAENTVMAYFKEKGFELVDRNRALANIEAHRIRAAATGDEKAATALGALAGAEVIVVGTANSGKPESVRGILYAATPTMSIRALNTGNASIYATATEVGKGQGATPDQAQKTALQQTAQKAGREIFWKIVQAWNEEKLNGAPVELVANGVTFSTLKRLKNDLSALEGVKDVVQREFAEPSATLTVYIIGDANRLAELIDGNNIATVTGVNSGKVTVKLK